MQGLADKIDERRDAHCAAVEAGYANGAAYVETYTPVNLAGPFPNLRCREIVKDIVNAVVETTTHIKMNDDQAYWFTLGVIRGARIVAQQDETVEVERFVVTLLDTFNKRGVSAVRELVEIVTGQPLPEPYVGRTDLDESFHPYAADAEPSTFPAHIDAAGVAHH